MLAGFAPSDSDLIGELAARAFPTEPGSAAGGLKVALGAVLPCARRGVLARLIDSVQLYAVRDPNGFRPLCLGRLGGSDGDGWVVASESPALATVGAVFVREIEPGELVIVGHEGVRSLRPFPPDRVAPKLCVFEFVYFARPDTELYGREVHATRRRMGERLATESPVEADLVIGVPDSRRPRRGGIRRPQRHPVRPGPGEEPLHREDLHRADRRGPVGRRPAQAQPVAGERRGASDLSSSTTRSSAARRRARSCGCSARREPEIHLRISSPPFRWPCFYGIDTPAAGGAARRVLGSLGDRRPAGRGLRRLPLLGGAVRHDRRRGDRTVLGLPYWRVSDTGARSPWTFRHLFGHLTRPSSPAGQRCGSARGRTRGRDRRRSGDLALFSARSAS